MGKSVDLVGKRFGKLLVLSKHADKDKNGKIQWLCKCDCGTEKLLNSVNLTGKNSYKSCGCSAHQQYTSHDLAGKKFGRLTVIEYIGKSKWKCKCDCGNTTTATSNDLITGKRVSCGCSTGVDNLVGKEFGNLTVISQADSISGRAMWNCLCTCGGTKIVSGKNLRSGSVKSCGCLHVHNSKKLEGIRFGKLVVIRQLESDKDGRAMWECKCDCGSIVSVRGKSLLNSNTKSCGCLRDEVGRKSLLDLTGKRFGRLVVVSRAENADYSSVFWNCVCDCGKTTITRGSDLVQCKSVSCGCLRTDMSIARNTANNNYPQWFIDELANEADKEKAIDNSLMQKDIVEFVCKEHGNYFQKVDYHIDMTTGEPLRGCPSCSEHIAYCGSKAENEIKDFLQELIPAEEISKARVLDMDGGRNKEIDIYVPNICLGIEYNGSAYHASKNSIYRDLDKDYHRDKFLSAKLQDIHLINIFDVDWNSNSDKIKQYLRDIVTDNNVVYARKCTINSVEKDIAVEFETMYHLQGSNKMMAKINYGLFLDEELLAVMSFGKLRMSKTEEGQYELHRYCVKSGYNIIGGANKLLKSFEREYNPKYIRSYSDNDYFTGNIYPRLGFKNSGQCTPRYYWFLNNKEIKREKCQLKRLKVEYPELLKEAYDTNAPNKEDYVMVKLGARKVYRSGNTKWEKYYKILEE